jgi:hypothetical protein
VGFLYILISTATRHHLFQSTYRNDQFTMASVAFPSIAKKAQLSDGTTYGYVHVPAKDSKPTLLFLHGCPSASYDWRVQIEHLPKLGYGLVVPDLLGYGDTDKPTEVEKYQLKYICPQVMELLDIEGLKTVIGVAHDWYGARPASFDALFTGCLLTADLK